LGSPRRRGNTAKVLAWVENELHGAGHQVDSYNILDYKVQGCTECLTCKKGKIELCSVKDDGNSLFRHMAASDLILLAAPVFCWGFPAQIKGLIDRLFCMMDFQGRRVEVPRLYDKSMALLLTAGGEEADNADLVIRGFQHLAALLEADMAGHLFIGGCTTPEELGDDAKARAVEFAKRLSNPK
jgi:multimeric flavodoxin WrbA